MAPKVAEGGRRAKGHVGRWTTASPWGGPAVTRVAATLGTTEHHLRRIFSALAGMPMSEDVRRRRMIPATAQVVGAGDLVEDA